MRKSLIAIFIAGAFLCGGVSAVENPSEKMARKLKIVIPKVNLKNVTAEQALEFLRRVSRDMDPKGEGINIIYVKSKEPKLQK